MLVIDSWLVYELALFVDHYILVSGVTVLAFCLWRSSMRLCLSSTCNLLGLAVYYIGINKDDLSSRSRFASHHNLTYSLCDLLCLDEKCAMNKIKPGIVLRKKRSRPPTVIVNDNSKVQLLTNHTERREGQWLDLGDSTDRLGHLIFSFKNNSFIFISLLIGLLSVWFCICFCISLFQLWSKCIC